MRGSSIASASLLTLRSVATSLDDDDHDHAVPSAAERAQLAGPLHPLAGAAVRPALHPRAEARVLRRAQRGRRLRHLSPVQVPRHRPGRRAPAVRRAGEGHPHLSTGAGAVHGLVRRPRLRDARRRGVPALRRRLPAHRRPSHVVVVPGACLRIACAPRGRLRGLRDAGRAGSSLAGRACRPHARGGHAGLLRPCARQGGRRGGDPVAHRLHRRPGFRDHRGGRQRGRRAGRGARGRGDPQHPSIRGGGADDPADRGRSAARRHRVARRPAGDERRRLRHSQGARLRLDAPRRP